MRMKSIFRSARAVVILILVSCSLLAKPNADPRSASGSPSSACAEFSYRQFDFWIGDWVVADVVSPAIVAHAKIDSILDGCVLREDYQATDGHAGQSLTVYDASRSVWHQTWVTNGGTLLEIEGKFENGEMMLSGRNQKGEVVRGTWKPVNGGVREMAEKSGDDGKTWVPWFDLMFRPRQTNSGTDDARDDPDHDKETVAALDTEYQAAVKLTDAATMTAFFPMILFSSPVPERCTQKAN
jgi:hypothetical protein